ncbi:MAG: phosphate acyltransferase PlsX [Elusimicrobiota bacterium]
MKLVLDAAAGDFGLSPNIEGAIQAANELGVQLLLVGPAAEVSSQLNSRGVASGDQRFEVIDAPDVIGMGEDPVAACRAKPRSSVMVSAELVASGRAEGLISVGNSGATMVAALWHLKRLPGVLRPAIAVAVPTERGMTLLLDGGANTECKPWHLLQFAVMGTIYAQRVMGVAKPKVGVLSVGEEDSKGNDLVREAIPLLRAAPVAFHGAVEGRDLAAGTVDVVVCDGFTGNIAVKLIEGTASAIFSFLKAEIHSGPLNKLGGLLLRGAFARLKKRMSYDEYGGAPLLGVGGTVIIAHGKSNAKAVANAIRTAKRLIETGVNEAIKSSIEQMKVNLESPKVQIS